MNREQQYPDCFRLSSSEGQDDGDSCFFGPSQTNPTTNSSLTELLNYDQSEYPIPMNPSYLQDSNKEDTHLQELLSLHRFQDSLSNGLANHKDEDLFDFENGQFYFFKRPDCNFTSNYQHSGSLSPHRTIDPGDQGDLSSDPSPVISKFISIINGNQEDQADQTANQSSNSIPLENPTVSVHQDESHLQSLTNPTLPNPRQNQSRANDSNNADKKMITILNSVLSSKQKKALKAYLDALQSKHRNIEVKIVKSSRYGFLQTLVILKHKFGNQFVLQKFSDFKAKLESFVQKIQMQPHSEINDYLLKLPKPYTQAYEQFLEGSIEKAMDILYARDDFKQMKYKQAGIQKVLKLEKDLANLAQ